LRDLGLVIPAKFASAPLAYDPAVGTWSPTDALVNLPAMFIIVLITILLVVGVRESANVNNAIVTIKLVIIVVFILAGVWFVKTSNWVTSSNPAGAFIPPNIGPGQYGWTGIIRGAGWSSLPTSVLTLYRLRPRKPGTRNGTCRSAFSDRSRFALSSMCW
jgi:APA family basic amino acid/polyamine antiporter